jgi:hypothetical protein
MTNHPIILDNGGPTALIRIHHTMTKEVKSHGSSLIRAVCEVARLHLLADTPTNLDGNRTAKPVAVVTTPSQQKRRWQSLVLTLLLVTAFPAVLATTGATTVGGATGRYEYAHLSSSYCSVSLILPDFHVPRYSDVPDDVLLVDNRCPTYSVASGVPYFPADVPAIITFCPAQTAIQVLPLAGYPLIYHLSGGGSLSTAPSGDAWDSVGAGCSLTYTFNGYYFSCSPGSTVTVYLPYYGSNPYANCSIADSAFQCACPDLPTELYSSCPGQGTDACAKTLPVAGNPVAPTTDTPASGELGTSGSMVAHASAIFASVAYLTLC